MSERLQKKMRKNGSVEPVKMVSKPDWAHRILRGRNRAWANGYEKGYYAGARDGSALVRNAIIKNLLADAVIITNADVRIIEQVVKIVEES